MYVSWKIGKLQNNPLVNKDCSVFRRGKWRTPSSLPRSSELAPRASWGTPAGCGWRLWSRTSDPPWDNQIDHHWSRETAKNYRPLNVPDQVGSAFSFIYVFYRSLFWVWRLYDVRQQPCVHALALTKTNQARVRHHDKEGLKETLDLVLYNIFS